MELRPALLPPEVDEAQVAQLAQIATEVVNRMDAGLDYSELIERFNALAARPYAAGDFDGAAGSMSMDEFARQALTPEPPYLPNISREEYLELIRRVMNGEGEYVFWLALLRLNLSCPPLSDYIFYDDLTPKQILEKALAYKPIAL